MRTTWIRMTLFFSSCGTARTARDQKKSEEKRADSRQQKKKREFIAQWNFTHMSHYITIYKRPVAHSMSMTLWHCWHTKKCSCFPAPCRKWKKKNKHPPVSPDPDCIRLIAGTTTKLWSNREKKKQNRGWKSNECKQMDYEWRYCPFDMPLPMAFCRFYRRVIVVDGLRVHTFFDLFIQHVQFKYVEHKSWNKT